MGLKPFMNAKCNKCGGTQARWRLRFTNLLFPRINLNDILNISSRYLTICNGRSDFDTMDFFEFIWLYERLAKEKKKADGEEITLDEIK